MGVDRLGEDFAEIHEIPLEIYSADWETYGKSAGMLRNEKMANIAEAALILWDGVSKGTKNMIELADHYKLKKFVYTPYFRMMILEEDD